MQTSNPCKNLLNPLCACAVALLALLPLTLQAEPSPPRGQQRAYAEAQAEYDVGHYAAAFDGFAALADAGHVDAARIALLMQRHGASLYGMRFAAGPKQLGRWAALAAPRPRAAASAAADLRTGCGDASARR